MADNIQVNTGTGPTIAADEVIDGTLGTVKVQFNKIMDGRLDGTNKWVVDSSGAGLVNQRTTTNVPAQTNVTQNTGSVTLLASNANRINASFFNDTSSGNLLIGFATPATSTAFWIKLAPGSSIALDVPVYTGTVYGIWDASASGACRVVEYT